MVIRASTGDSFTINVTGADRNYLEIDSIFATIIRLCEALAMIRTPA
ncbi:MAG: hypothetical protein MK171_05985 [Pirellulales bacterium]|nr:hypothetical protein [Pirellulales bacterium]